ncbi:MAG TPA: hypothetical protein VFN87_17705 [Solirubrobacteraceae bacterium]|nr:hypothetical protein [Solirubrobacteraceae bacterium]
MTHVEIHNDKANTARAGVPRKLGFILIDERPDTPSAPAEIGISVADAYLLATARHTGAAITTFDRKVQQAAQREGLTLA